MKDPNKLPKKDRPSPSDSAKLFEVGKKKKGNDGNMYIIDVDKNNVKKWKIFKKDRPSPSESAKLFEVGTKKKGNDGNMYIIDVDKNGVKRWKMNKKKQDMINTVKQVLTIKALAAVQALVILMISLALLVTYLAEAEAVDLVTYLVVDVLANKDNKPEVAI